MSKRLKALLTDHFSGVQNPLIDAITIDSRQVRPGYLFLAVPGFQRDARQFIPQAISQGASAIAYDTQDHFQIATQANIPVLPVPDLQHKLGYIASCFYDDPSKTMPVIAVTGTNGKTSCCLFIAQLLAKLNKKCGVIGTLGNGVWPHLVKGAFTTPDALQLQQTFSTLKQHDCEIVAMEASSHAIEQQRIAGVHIDIGVFTQLSRDHLDYHRSMQAYAFAKKQLFLQPGMRYAVVNLDDSMGCEIAQDFKTKLKIIGYSLRSQSTTQPFPVIALSQCQAVSVGYHLQITLDGEKGEFILPLLGRYNIANIFAVIGALKCVGLSLQEILMHIPSLVTATGRMQTLGGKKKPLVVVDFAHTPDALQNVLLALREHCKGQLWCVFGCGGDRDTGKRAQMGAIAAKWADTVVITNDNPRSESPEMIANMIFSGIPNHQTATLELDREAAIAFAVQSANVNDVVLIAGKGHETEQVIGDTITPFSDIEHVQKQLKARN